ncbi:MAG: DUF4926 domain-containing protein [Candidatus Poribacteria bacterium]|nr:DUF4926 domain-containing protein [Candidatus Poribacteria bacterium]
MSRFRDLELVALARDIPEFGLKAGDLGTVVFLYEGKGAYEVEFTIRDGDPLDPITLTDDDVRPIQPGEILHVRQVTV